MDSRDRPRASGNPYNDTPEYTPDEPEYYSELLHLLHHQADRNSLAVKRFDPDLDFREPLEGLDSLDSLLDNLALASIPAPGYTCALTASIGRGQDDALLSTTLYVIFDRPVTDPNAIASRLHRLFSLIQSRPLPTGGRDSTGLSEYLAGTFSDLLLEIYDYSWEVFVNVVCEWKGAFQMLREFVEGPRPIKWRANDPQRPASDVIFEDLNRILEAVEASEANELERKAVIQLVGQVFNKWHQRGLLPRQNEDNATVYFDRLDVLSSRTLQPSFRIRQWIFDIFSFHTGALTLLTLWLSERHTSLFRGSFRVEVMSSPTILPYSCQFPQESIRTATSYAVEASQPIVECPTKPEQAMFSRMLRRAAMKTIQDSHPGKGNLTYRPSNPSVHCEIALLLYLRVKGISSVDYIGTSVSSCEACTISIVACSKRVNETVARRDRQKKYFTGWTFPSDIDPIVENEILPLVLEALQTELGKDCNRWLNWKFVEDRGGEGS